MDSAHYKKALSSAYNRVHNQWPRLQIMIILGLTGMAAFLTSAVLLRVGVTQMVVRYPVAIAAAYGVFIMLIGLWLWMQSNDTDMLDVVEEGLENINWSGGGRVPSSGGSVNLTGMSAPPVSGGTGISTPPVSGGSGGGSGGQSFDIVGVDVDLDDAIWVVLAIVVLIAGLLAVLYIVYIAPILLTEVLVDGLMAAGLYKRIKGVEGRGNWMTTVLRKTAIPAILALIFFSIAGFCVQKLEPEASSIGEAWRLMRK